MYKNRILFTIFLLSQCLLYSGCSKPGGDKEYTVSGHLYQNCSRQPIANQPLALLQCGYSGGELAPLLPDANGYF